MEPMGRVCPMGLSMALGKWARGFGPFGLFCGVSFLKMVGLGVSV